MKLFKRFSIILLLLPCVSFSRSDATSIFLEKEIIATGVGNYQFSATYSKVSDFLSNERAKHEAIIEAIENAVEIVENECGGVLSHLEEIDTPPELSRDIRFPFLSIYYSIKVKCLTLD